MSRPHDLGGSEGFGPVPGTTDDSLFVNDWEARVFGLQRVLLAKGLYTLDEFRDALERSEPKDYLSRPYYQRWMEGVITLLVEREVVSEAELAQS